jgi:hypothetical protein
LLAVSLIASGSELPVPACLRRFVGSRTNDQQSEIFLHIHHYLQGLMLVPWTCHASASGQIAFAVGLGVWIEGAFGVLMLPSSLALLTALFRPFPCTQVLLFGVWIRCLCWKDRALTEFACLAKERQQPLYYKHALYSY